MPRWQTQQRTRQHQTPLLARQLLHASDLLRAGLAGTLRDYPLASAAGDVRPLAELDYNGMPAGYACQPACSPAMGGA